ncbi:UDP-glucuronate:xylan alpha-glucuronosyltransferase 1 [Sesamum angolense]|uniref:UDP-glucuronate:xylan alpha-glucuronosyltransferase 1 n=2 Tax=Magnoliopsida TaxID=3398 RepID=A0AAE2BQ84_9LAMI|nr:UDP-glucuronate:xylan alpha-glucuronosyltransferase 1 [Sesamum angolense]
MDETGPKHLERAKTQAHYCTTHLSNFCFLISSPRIQEFQRVLRFQLRHTRTGKEHDEIQEAQSADGPPNVYAQDDGIAVSEARANRNDCGEVQAKEVRRLADNMVQLGKEGTLCAARQAAAFVRGDDVLHKLFTELAYRYKAGGYTRLLRTRIRVGDAAPMAYIEFIDRENELRQSKPPVPSRHRGQPWIPGQDLDSPDNSHHLKKRRDLSLTIELSSQTMQLELHLRVLFASCAPGPFLLSVALHVLELWHSSAGLYVVSLKNCCFFILDGIYSNKERLVVSESPWMQDKEREFLHCFLDLNLWLALPAVTELTCVNRDDAYKRKLQRIKVRSVENPFNFATGGKNAKWKFQPLKLVLIIVVLGLFFAFLSSPTVCHQNGTSHTVSRWIWGGSDPRYISDLDISWEEILRALNRLPYDNKIQRVGLLNFNRNEIHKWQHLIPNANHTVLHLDYADKNLTWESLYPEWIDEVQENEVPSCPSLPSPEVPRERLDLIAVKLPCRKEGNWSRDIARLHLQIAAANLAASCKGIYHVHVLFVTSCFPVPNLFTCKDLVAHEGKTWLYKPNLTALRKNFASQLDPVNLGYLLEV